jgi:transcriptional regulator GlxA family with amidase domain
MQSIRQAVFILPPNVHLLDITGPAHIFYEAACYGAPVKLLFSSIFSGESGGISSAMLSFANLVPFDQLDLSEGDIVFVPGLDALLLLDDDFLRSSYAFQQWLVKQYENGVSVCSVCTGAFLLAEAGLLDGRSCTTHWKYTERFSQRYPKAKLQVNRLFVQEGHLYTSAGVSAGIDLALHIVEQFWGAHLAAQVAKEVVIYFRRTQDDLQLSVFTQYRNHLEHRIHCVQDRLMRSLQEKLSIELLANEVNMSPRNLTRLFKKTTNLTIGAYLDKLRAARAAQLVKEGQTLYAAASQCGLRSTNQLRRLMKK